MWLITYDVIIHHATEKDIRGNTTRKVKAGVISKNFNKGARGAMSGNGCGSFAATPIFLKIKT